jgi:hypothetical protein
MSNSIKRKQNKGKEINFRRNAQMRAADFISLFLDTKPSIKIDLDVADPDLYVF